MFSGGSSYHCVDSGGAVSLLAPLLHNVHMLPTLVKVPAVLRADEPCSTPASAASPGSSFTRPGQVLGQSPAVPDYTLQPAARGLLQFMSCSLIGATA